MNHNPLQDTPIAALHALVSGAHDTRAR